MKILRIIFGPKRNEEIGYEIRSQIELITLFNEQYSGHRARE